VSGQGRAVPGAADAGAADVGGGAPVVAGAEGALGSELGAAGGAGAASTATAFSGPPTWCPAESIARLPMPVAAATASRQNVAPATIRTTRTRAHSPEDRMAQHSKPRGGVLRTPVPGQSRSGVPSRLWLSSCSWRTTRGSGRR
jgi:hypothetical protein